MHSPGTEYTNAQELKELRPTRTCTRVRVTVCDRLARRLLGLDFVNWQQRQSGGWPWSGNSVQVREGIYLWYRPRVALTVINELHLLCFMLWGRIVVAVIHINE